MEILLGILGYVTFIGLIIMIASIKSNECNCKRNEYGKCPC